MATDKNFVIKNGLTVGTSEVITSAGNLTNIGTISSGAITSTGTSTFGTGIIVNTSNNTVNTTQPSFRKGSSGEAFIDAAGHIVLNIDTNNNNTDRYFGVSANASYTTPVFKVFETGQVHLLGSSRSIRADGPISFNSTTGAAQAGLFKSVAAQTSYANSASDGMFNALNGYAVGTGVGQTVIDASRNLTINEDLNFSTNGFADISNTGTGAIRFKPSSQTLALTLTGANATFAGNLDVDGIIDNTRNNGNVSAPNTSDHTAGTRINFYDANATSWYAMGIENSTLWFNTDSKYKWYEDAALRMTLDGANLSVTGTVTATGGNSTNWNTAYTYSQTDADVLRKRTDIPGSANLNTYTSIGLYHQNSNSQATSGSNYPANIAGMLTVTADGVMVYQTYQGYQTQSTYERKYYNGTWESWHQVYDSGVFTNNSTNWNTAYGWGNHASAGYLTSYTDTNTHTHLDRTDNRTISPSEYTSGDLNFGFTSYANDNSSPYADFIHMRSYTDSSGGADNLVMFKKSGIGMRLWQQTFGSSTAYSNYEDVWHTGNLTATNKANYDTAFGWGNHASQSYATQSYVGTQISNLVDSSPAALNTLNELAAALGDNENFATDVTASIAAKLPLAGGTMTGNLVLDSGTSTLLNVKCDNGGNAIVRAGGDGQGTGAFEVSQDNGTHGGGMSYNGDGSPAYVSGETSDHVTFYRINAGTRSEVFHYGYSSDTVNFNGNITLGGTVDGVDIAARDAVLTSTTATANAALPKAGGTMTGALTLSVDTTDCINFSANSTANDRGIAFNNRSALTADYNDGYLRLNQNSEFTNGVFTPANIRADGYVQTGALRINTTTIMDSARNLTNINLVKFRDHGSSFYISPTNTNTLNAGYSQAGDTSDIWINYRGYQDGTTYFRDFRIGDGKNVGLLFVDGSSGEFQFGYNSKSTNINLVSGNYQIGGQTVIDSSRNLTAVGITSSGAFSNTSSDRARFGAGTGNNQGLNIMFGSGASDYGVTRYYSGSTNTHTIHVFSSAWQSGNFESGSAGAINIEGALGVTFGSWNAVDGYIRRTTGNTYFKGNLQIGDYSGSHEIEIASGQNTAGYLRFNDVNDTEGSYVRSTGASASTGGDLVFGSRWNTDTDRIYMEMTTTEVQTPNTMFKMASGSFMFGGNNNAKESNSAQISAGQHQSNSLNFVGMASGTSSADRRMDFWVEGGAYFRGDVVATGNVTAYGSTSDKRLKKDIVKIDNAIDKIKSVSGYEFAWNENAPKDKQDKREFGVIAQEVEEAGLDKLVFEYERPVSGTDEDNKHLPEEKWKAVHYDKFVPILIEAIKEQQKDIEKLKEEVSSLRSKI
jgi:hypothetical protein